MLKVSRPTPAHFGIYVTDLDLMVRFYTEVFELTITDTGVGRTFKNKLVFTSASPDQHHQLVIASGRPADAKFSTVMQLSFVVPDIQAMRDIWAKAETCGATNIRGLNHGNALSVYMLDPEGNTVEVYVDTPFYVEQPHGDPLDLSRTDEEILSETEAICRRDPSFKALEEWQTEFLSRAPEVKNQTT
jgi:catechol 2,3-dioxygenase